MAVIFENSINHSLIATVMIIDDQLTSRIILETIIQSIGDNIKVKTYDNAFSALQVAETEPPDLIIADYKMPELDGVEFTRRLRKLPYCHDVPIIIITIVDERAVMYEALEAGATDFLIKPVDHYECKVRCRNLLTMRRQQLIIRNRANSLEKQVKEAIGQFRTREKESLYRLALLGENKDYEGGNHQVMIGNISLVIAEQLGMDQEFCNTIEIAAQLHDIGKSGIPENILLKESSLNSEESAIIKQHTTIGYELLKDGSSPYMQMGASIARSHHERFGGNGYPDGISGEHIPIEARIVAVADMFDAMITDRPYRNAIPVEQARNTINDYMGDYLDPKCAMAFLSRFDEIVASREKQLINGRGV